MVLAFTKMQGLGNDFIVIDSVTEKIELTVATIQFLTDRHLGVGCDQVLLLTKAEIPAADFSYQVFNADGSEALQCGNGVRCLAKFVKIAGLSAKRRLRFATKAGSSQAQVEDNGMVTVTLGAPLFELVQIPLVAEKKALRYNLPVAAYGEVSLGALSLGNPHAVMVVTDIERAPVATVGAGLAACSYFPQGVNVNFMQVVDSRTIKLRVYERGSGETLACGSGASAAVVIGRLWELLDATVTVQLLGGDLVINWSGLGAPVNMTGPAELVFRGEINLTR